MQPVVNLYEAASYMCAYISKAEDETSKSMKEAVKESPTRNKSDYKKIKPIARAYVTKREYSLKRQYILPCWHFGCIKNFHKSFYLIVTYQKNVAR